MNIYVLDRDLERQQTPIEVYTSFLWCPSYDGLGTFELTCNTKYFSLLQTDMYIQNSDDDEHFGVIEYVDRVENLDNTVSLSVRGRMGESLLGRRVAQGANDYTGVEPSYVIGDMVDKNCISATDTTRNIPLLEVGSLATSDFGTVTYSSKSPNLLDEIVSLCKSSGLGFNLALDDVNKKLTLKVVKGLNRTADQEVNTQVILSRDRGNILSSQYTKDTTNDKNFAFIEDSEGAETTYSKSATTGLDKKEVFLSLQTGVLQEAKTQLSKLAVSELLDNVMNLRSNLVYGVDFSLGDVVTCMDSSLGFSTNLRVTGVTEAWGSQGYSISLTLGDEAPSLVDIITSVILQQ